MKGSGNRPRRGAAALAAHAGPAALEKTRSLSLVGTTSQEPPAERVAVALLVSESTALAKVLERVLLPAGYSVEVVVSPAVVLQRLHDRPIACLLLDLRSSAGSVMRLLGGLARGGVEAPVFIVDESGDAVAEVRPVGAVAADSQAASTDDHALVARLRAAESRRGRAANRRAEELQRLTPRERDVLKGVVEGLSNKAIAESLGISDRTVEAHRGRLMAKLKARSVVSLVRLVLENGGVASLTGAAPR